MTPYLSNLSPYYSAAIEFEEKVFLRLAYEREQDRQKYEEGVKDSIKKVLVNFHTGLHPIYTEQHIPRLIFDESQKYGFDPLFITALIITESSFYNHAKSSKGALGLMQIQPATGIAIATETQIRWNGQNTLYDPEVNIAFGAYYLDKLIKRFGDLTLALEAYNYGPTQINKLLRQGYRPHRYSNKVYSNYKRVKSQSYI